MKKNTLIILLLLLAKGSVAQFITNTGIEINNSTYVTTNADWTNDATTRITNNGVINTSESFVNNGVLDKASAGGFTLRYDSDLAFRAGGSYMGYLTKEGSGTLVLIETLNVKDSLLIKDGIISLSNSKDSVILKPGAELAVGSNSWIEGGFIARAGTGDLLFPFGKDGMYLPLKLYKVNAQKVTASITEAPPTHVAGPGVDALIGFPYAWQVAGKDKADTAAYVEVNYPLVLPVVANPIIVREVPKQEYASMGARHIADDGSRLTVKSYSRRLNGLFTVAQGFPSDWTTDSLALVSLYQSTGGASWANNTNWLTSDVEQWFGVTVNGQSITAVELPANNLKGPVADPLVDILSLQTLNLSANGITALPDFTLNPEVTSLNVSDNNLDFTSLEPNASVLGLNYFIQGDIGEPSSTEIPVGTTYEFSVPTQGQNSLYQWKRNGESVSGANEASFVLPAITRENMGEYVAEITNSLLPGLILKSSTQKVLAHATVSGVLLADASLPAEGGEVTLFRVQPGAFQPVSTVQVNESGSYTFERVILDDYQIRAFADTLLHNRALPTYYTSTIYWEEADTLQVADNIAGLDILSQLEPGPPSGRGSISGFFEEDDGTGRAHGIELAKRVEKAGVSVRRVERAGRTKAEILTLVAYVFTNSNGEFTLPNLPTGEYRINFQYPGFPMDETSFTTINIGTGFESQVMVEARIIDNKINVQKVTITGVFETENYHAEVFPNPARNFIELRFAGEVTGRMITLTDLQGRTLYTSDASQKELSLNIRDFQTGIYLLKIEEQGEHVKTVKIIIE